MPTCLIILCGAIIRVLQIYRQQRNPGTGEREQSAAEPVPITTTALTLTQEDDTRKMITLQVKARNLLSARPVNVDGNSVGCMAWCNGCVQRCVCDILHVVHPWKHRCDWLI